MQTFLQFKTKITQRLWPSREVLSLIVPHNAFFQNGMLDIQKWVPCLKQYNIDTWETATRYWDHALTVVDAPFGQIRRVYTVAGGTDRWRDKVFYRSSNYGELVCWSNRLYKAVTPVNSGLPVLPFGLKKEEAASDSQYGRARIGGWAVHRGKLYIAPWLQSTEMLIVEWDGEKRQWQDSDGVHEKYWRQDAEMAVQHYVGYMHELYYGDRAIAANLHALYEKARADIMYWCRENTRQIHNTVCEGETGGQGAITYISSPGGGSSTNDDDDPIVDPGEQAEEDEVLFAAVGDMGHPSAEATAVGDAIEAENPKKVLALGDITYNNNYAADFGINYQWAIDATPKKLIPVPGNHDWDVDGTLAAYKAYFADFIGNNGHNYEAAAGPIHFFIYDSDARFADGYDAASIQAEWLRVKMLLSTARWKIVLMHRPPFSSSAVHGSDADLQLDFKDWGADLVLAGHVHNYERLEVDGLPYINVGTGGRPLYAFGAAIAGSQIRIGQFGYLTGEANCDEMVLQFKSPAGVVLDSITLTKE